MDVVFGRFERKFDRRVVRPNEAVIWRADMRGFSGYRVRILVGFSRSERAFLEYVSDGIFLA